MSANRVFKIFNLVAAAGHAEDIIFTTLAYNGPNNDQEIQVS